MPNRHDGMAVFALAPDVVMRVVDGESVLLKLHGEEVYSLNETGTRVVQLMAEGRSLADVIVNVAQEYALSASQVEGDVLGLMELLEQQGLIVRAARESTP